MLRVLIVHSPSISAFPSGELHVAKLEFESLKELNLDVKLICSEFDPKTRIKLLRLIIAGISFFWSWSSYFHIKRVISSYSPDIVHFHGLFPYLSPSVLFAAHNSGVTVIQTLHNGRWLCLEGGFYRSGRYCNKCVRESRWLGVRHGCKGGVIPSLFLFLANIPLLASGRLFRWVDHFIAVSDFIKDQHVSSGFPVNQITVKNNGIRIPSICIDPDFNNRSGFAYIGRVTVSKGSNVLISLIDSISVPIHIVGDGPDLVRIKQHCLSHSYDHVNIWGKQSQTFCFDILSSVLCSIVPSQCGEAFPLSAVESMSLATPVVCSDIGGLGPLIDASGGGVQVNYQYHSEFVSAVQNLLDNPHKAEFLGLKGRNYVFNNLVNNAKAHELVSVYNYVINNKIGHVN